MRINLLVVLMLMTPAYVHGDYLELTHSAALKAEPRNGSETIARLEKQTRVILTQEEQDNGYYRVRVTETGEEGWIYRTMGRRHVGLPEAASSGDRDSAVDHAPPDEDAFAVPESHGWGNPSKVDGCRSKNGLPDPACTPGEILTEKAEQLCSSTFRTGSVRNKTTSQTQKNRVYPRYGITHPEHNTGANQVCEIDHLVALELGGADTLANLWPECSPGYEHWGGPGYRDKDGFENYLWFHVCVNGDISLKDAQIEIAANWRKYWELAGKPECHNRNKCE
jgi:hypothetical protein